MAAPPKKPPIIGKPPVRGVPNPLYPIAMGMPFEPKGDYRSSIDVQPPINPSAAKVIANVRVPSSNPMTFVGDFAQGVADTIDYKIPAAAQMATDAGQKSLSAFSRALTDTSKNAIKRSSDEFNVAYRQQAEKSRADDIVGQRQNTMDRHNLDTSAATQAEDVSTKYKTDWDDIWAWWKREKAMADLRASMALVKGLMSFI